MGLLLQARVEASFAPTAETPARRAFSSALIVGGPLPLAPALMNGQTHYASQGGIVTVPPAVNAARRHPSSRAITAIVIAVVIVALAAVGVFLAFVFAAVQPTYTRSNPQAGT